MPAIVLRNHDKLGKRARTIYSHTLCIRAKMPPAGQTIPAMAAGDVTFTDDEIARSEPLDMVADGIDHPDKLMPDRHRNGDRLLCPRIPIVNVDIGAADGRFHNPNPDIIAAYFGHRDILQPKPSLRLCFHDGFHRLGHTLKLGKLIADVDRSARSETPGAL